MGRQVRKRSPSVWMCIPRVHGLTGKAEARFQRRQAPWPIVSVPGAVYPTVQVSQLRREVASLRVPS